ncbi:MAG: leucine-rich repeat protein [Oscillospiraceae bacterium]|jgi:hypothetical protein|nr:leucine-rich repeat protein [Oscillospiraceae bacterium]
MKKILSVITATALALGMMSSLPMSASPDIVVITNPPTSAETEVTEYKNEVFYGEEFTYTFMTDGTAVVIDYVGTGGNAVIPSEVNGYKVTRIANYNVFGGKNAIYSVSIPETVEEIGLGSSSFAAGYQLTEINVDEDNPYYASIDGVLYNKDITGLLAYPPAKAGEVIIPDTVTYLAGSAFENCKLITSVTIPDSVESIINNAFKNCTSLTSVTIGNGVTTISEYAFRNCTSLVSIVLGNNVEIIESSAFYDCKSLTEINLPDSLTKIGQNVFSDCISLKSITIPKNLKTIHSWTFLGDELTNINVDDENPYFASIDGVLFDKELKKLIIYPAGREGDYVIPDGVTEIVQYAFYKQKYITSVTLPDSITEIGNYAFYECHSLVSINIPNSLEKMNPGFLGDCPLLKSINIPEHLTEIISDAFRDCTSLTEISISKNVTFIGDAFQNCTSLTEINVDEDNTNYASVDGVLFNKDLTELLIFPGGKSGDYVIPDSVTEVSYFAFNRCDLLTSLVIPDSVTEMNYSIGRCPMLTSITIGSGLTKTGFAPESSAGEIFIRCPALTEINVDDDNPDFADIDGVLFNKDFTDILAYPKGLAGGYVIPDTVTRILDSAFANCTLLTDITIPDSVTVIDVMSFGNCTSLTSVVVPASVTHIYGSMYEGSSGGGSFGGCTSLTSLTIMNPETRIGEGAFYGSKNLIIYSYTGSYAEQRAKSEDIPFIPIDKTQEVYGDIDRDDEVGIVDVVIVAKIVHSGALFSEELLAAADLNEDNVVNVIEFALIKYKLLNSKTLTEE